MGIRRKPFYNNRQLERVLIQLTSVFAGYQVETGDQRDGESKLRDVPVIYGDLDRVAAYLMGPRQNVENGMTYVPIIAVHVKGMRQYADYRQQPQHHEYYHAVELARDPDGRIIPGKKGKSKTIERYMPVPYEVALSVSIWASNNAEGFQLIEQIATQFNPDQEIQFSNSAADWTMLSTLTFDGEIEFEKSYPSGSDVDPLYVYTLGFRTIIWLSVPAKEYQPKRIHQINVDVNDYDVDYPEDSDTLDTLVILPSNDDPRWSSE